MFIMLFSALFWTFVVQDGSAGAPSISLHIHRAMTIKAILILKFVNMPLRSTQLSTSQLKLSSDLCLGHILKHKLQ